MEKNVNLSGLCVFRGEGPMITMNRLNSILHTVLHMQHNSVLAIYTIVGST